MLSACPTLKKNMFNSELSIPIFPYSLFVFIFINLFKNLNVKIFLFFILCFPLLLFSFSGFNGESIIYVLKYIVNFLIKQKLYLFKKSP